MLIYFTGTTITLGPISPPSPLYTPYRTSSLCSNLQVLQLLWDLSHLPALSTHLTELVLCGSILQVLQLLWDLSHLPALSTHLIELALDEHLAILNDSYTVKDQVKRQYVAKCVDDIKKGACVLPALKQLHQLSKNILKHSFKQDKVCNF